MAAVRVLEMTACSSVLHFRTRWLVESPQRFVREHELPQIPSWLRVFNVPLNEEKADPITVNNIMGSIFILFGGMALACGSFIVEYSVLFARIFL